MKRQTLWVWILGISFLVGAISIIVQADKGAGVAGWHIALVITTLFVSVFGTDTARRLSNAREELEHARELKRQWQSKADGYREDRATLYQFARMFGTQEVIDLVLQRRAILLRAAFEENVSFINGLEAPRITQSDLDPEEVLGEQLERMRLKDARGYQIKKQIEERKEAFWSRRDLVAELCKRMLLPPAGVTVHGESHKDYLPGALGINYIPETEEERETLVARYSECEYPSRNCAAS